MALSDGALNLLAQANTQAISAVNAKRQATAQQPLTDAAIRNALTLALANVISSSGINDEPAGQRLLTFRPQNATYPNFGGVTQPAVASSIGYMASSKFPASATLISNAFFCGLLNQFAAPAAMNAVIRYIGDVAYTGQETRWSVAFANIDVNGPAPTAGSPGIGTDNLPTGPASVRQVIVPITDLQGVGTPSQYGTQVGVIVERSPDTFTTANCHVLSIELYSA